MTKREREAPNNQENKVATGSSIEIEENTALVVQTAHTERTKTGLTAWFQAQGTSRSL